MDACRLSSDFLSPSLAAFVLLAVLKMRRTPSLLLPVLGPLASATAVLRQNVPPALLPRQAGSGVCQATQPTVAAPHENIWAGLTNQEMADALAFLYNSKELNLTRDGGR